jgi:membrane-associated protein
MEIVRNIVDIVLHVDKHLDFVIKNFGNFSYLLLFAIIFCETGLVVTPFLPGDSLLFVVGAFVAVGSFSLFWVFVTLVSAAVIGDSVNYALGKVFGQKLVEKGDHRFFKKEHIEKTHKFYEKYGGKTIILARFIPIIRTFAPFVAGIGKMSYYKFFAFNVIGGILWVVTFLAGGYFLGNIPVVKKNFSLVILIIVVVSVAPVVSELWKHHKERKALR